MLVRILLACASAMCLLGLAQGEDSSLLPEGEIAGVKQFVADFGGALQSNEVERVRKMSGETWAYWKGCMQLPGKYEGIEIVSIEAGESTNVLAKIHSVGGSGVRNTSEAVISLVKMNGDYCIANLDLTESRRMNEELEGASVVVENLVRAINNREMSEIRGLVTFGDAENLELELENRGLSWIREFMATGVRVKHDGVARKSDETLTGGVKCVSSARTNSVMKFVFVNSKIDRAPLPEEPVEVRTKRFMDEVFGHAGQ